MISTISDYYKHKEEIKEICDIIRNSDSVHTDAISYEEISVFGGIVMKVPSCYGVNVDYNRMANALYQAGYRKTK